MMASPLGSLATTATIATGSWRRVYTEPWGLDRGAQAAMFGWPRLVPKRLEPQLLEPNG